MRYKKALTLTMLVVTMLFLYYSLSAAPLVSDSNYTYLGGLQWYNTYDEGLKVAVAENKPMLVYFWAIWCTWCEKMNTEVYPDKEVSAILKEDFILVAVDLDANKEDVRRFNVQYPPNEIFVSPKGEVITRIPGYVRKEDFLPILLQVRSSPAAEISLGGELPQTRR